MTFMALHSLLQMYGTDLTLEKAVHLHDEDEQNEWTLSYKGIVVGSELVPAALVRNNIEDLRKRGI